RIGQDKVETAGGVVRIVVVGDGFANVPFKSVDGQIHSAQPHRLANFFVAVNGEFLGGVAGVALTPSPSPIRWARVASGSLPLVLGNKSRGGNEHTARTARGVEHAPVVRLKDFDDQPDDAGRCVELAAFLSFGAGKFAEKVLVNAPEGVVVHCGGNLGDFFQQFLEEGAGEDVVGLGQDAGELGGVVRDVAD